MIDFPESTHVHRRIPKEAFYKHLSITSELKEKFVSDVDRIYVEWSLTKENLHLDREADTKEILVLIVELKRQEFAPKIIEVIAKQNPHRLVFLLCYEQQRKLVIYHGKLYESEWMESEQVQLLARGYSLDEIWDHIIEQIALRNEEKENDLSIEERLKRKDEIEKLIKLIDRTENAAWKEQQPKKRFELYSRLQEYQKKLKAMRDGET